MTEPITAAGRSVLRDFPYAGSIADIEREAVEPWRKAALDALALLPPDRQHLLRPETHALLEADAIQEQARALLDEEQR